MHKLQKVTQSYLRRRERVRRAWCRRQEASSLEREQELSDNLIYFTKKHAQNIALINTSNPETEGWSCLTKDQSLWGASKQTLWVQRHQLTSTARHAANNCDRLSQPHSQAAIHDAHGCCSLETKRKPFVEFYTQRGEAGTHSARRTHSK